MKKKEARWKGEQKEKNRKKQKTVIGYWLFVAGLLLVLGLGLKTFQMFKNSLWDGESRVNFAIAGKEVSLVSFEPQEGELVVLIIPGKTMIEVAHGYGAYRAEAVWGLEDLEERRGLLVESLQENLGVPVGGWIKAATSNQLPATNKEEVLGALARQIQGQGKTNFTRWDLGRLWWQVRKLRSSSIKVLDLSKISVLSSQTLPDQTQVWEIDSARLDSYLAKFFLDSKMREENLEIEILNGTSHFGLAERGARMITNMGGMVVRVGNFELQVASCKLQVAKNKKNLYAVRKIGKIFNCVVEEKKEEGTAEITLILGEDYWQKLNQK